MRQLRTNISIPNDAERMVVLRCMREVPSKWIPERKQWQWEHTGEMECPRCKHPILEFRATGEPLEWEVDQCSECGLFIAQDTPLYVLVWGEDTRTAGGKTDD